MQAMRLKFGERRNDWQCCFCCHVRTGTIFLGVWHLMIQVLALSVMAVVLRNPELVRDDDMIKNPVLPTPLSEVDENRPTGILGQHLAPHIEGSIRSQVVDGFGRQEFSTAHYRDIFGHRNLSYQDLNVGVIVTFCTCAITLLMVYGAVKGKPAYLMPFFCLQVFDFCIASLTAVGYLCYLPDVHRLVAKNNRLPFQEELLSLNPQCLSLLVLVTFMVLMMFKAYFIGVVWSCYKYLSLRLVAAQRTIHFIDPDNQSLLPDLPDYETAMCDPRFAVKKYPAPPPSYASATGINNGGEPTATPAAASTSASPPPAPIHGATPVTVVVSLPPEDRPSA